MRRALLVAVLLLGTAQADPNRVGMNLGWVTDYAPERWYADLVKSSRMWFEAGSQTTVLTSQDANGWPTVSDAELFLFGDIDQMHGTYAVSFTGHATSVSSVTGLSYNSGTNTSTGTITLASSAQSTLTLSVRGAYRTSGTSSPGLTNLKVMRPETVGGSTPFPASSLFALTKGDASATPFATFLRKFAALRFMDPLATNGNPQTTWSTRRPPSYRTQGDYYDPPFQGMSWEHVVLFANEVFSDAATVDRAIWINVPSLADDTYVTNLANLLRYGSDGTNAYTSVQGSPVFPPLDANIKLYVEWSNEVWNSAGGFSQTGWNLTAAQNEVNAGGSPLNYDALYNGGMLPVTGNAGWELAWRRIAKRGAEVSVIFRGVFGDSAMMTRIRPVYMTQAGRIEEFYEGARFLLNYNNNLGGSFVGTPHPPSYYFYAAGGAGYWNPDVLSDALTVDNIWTSASMVPSAFGTTWLVRSTDWATALGLKRVAYEGGPAFDGLGHSESVKASAWGDSRMRQNFVDHHTVWSQYGGDLLVYYKVGDGYQWGFLPFAGDPYGRGYVWQADAAHSPKIGALDDILGGTRAAITYGTGIPGTVAGGAQAADYNSNTGSGGTLAVSSTGNKWAAYSFRADTSLTGASVTLSKTGTGTPAVYVDGASISGDGTTFSAGTLSAGLHGVIVRASSGSFTLSSVAMDGTSDPGALSAALSGIGSLSATLTSTVRRCGAPLSF